MLHGTARARLCAAAVKTVRFSMLWGLVAASLGRCAWAQSSADGAISGYVGDAGGAALAGASVEARNVATGARIAATSGSRGEFLIPSLAAGDYEVTLDYNRFSSVTLAPVTVQVGEETAVEARLRVAAVTSSVTVVAPPEPSSAPTQEELASEVIANVITPEELDRLPDNGRRWQSFARLTPGAHADPDSDSLLTFRGLPATQNSTRVDGAEADQSFGAVPLGTGIESSAEAEDAEESGSSPRRGSSEGGGGAGGGYGRHAGMAYTFSQEAVREFRVSGQNYSALYGHAAGGVISTVSKSGSNELHGSAFYLARSSAFGATNPFSIENTYVNGVVSSAAVKPRDLRQQFGGAVGAAAVQDRLFFFYAYDQQRRNFPAISSPQAANFFSLTATQTALLANRGVTAAKTNAALNYLDSLTGSVPRRQDQTINFAKLDYHAEERHAFSLQYNRARSSAPAGSRSSPVVYLGRASLGSSYSKIDAAVGRWTWRLTPNLNHDVRVQYGRGLQYEEAKAPLPQEAAISPGGYSPEVAIGPEGFTFGTSYALGRKAYPNERRVELADLVTWVRGRNQVQAGVDVSFVHDDIVGLNNTQGAFHYDSGVTNGHAGGLVDWITDYTFNTNAYPNGGCPSIFAPIHDFCFRSFSQSFGQQSVSFGTQEWAAFAQNDWRVRTNLTVHAGVRYEYEFLPLPQQPNLALDTAFGSTGATSVFPEDRNNFGPRAGVAWSPFGAGRGVVRAGYGLFYGRLPGAAIRSALVDTAEPASATHILILPTTVTNCPQVANQGFGYVCTYDTAPPAAVAATTSAMVFDRRFRLPAVQQGSLTLEREVGAGFVASASYLMNLDRQLPNSVDINIAPATATKLFQLQGGTGAAGVRDGETFAVPVYTQRVNTNFGPVTDIVSNANASYNAAVVEARRRSRGGLELRASYTWSKALDYGQTAGATPRTNTQFDPFNLHYDHGLSSLNYSHRIVAAAVWQPALGRRFGWAAAALNGFRISPIFFESSGRPYTLQIFGGTRLKGGHQSINGSGGAVYLPTVGRNTLRLPDRSQVDLRVTRDLWSGERLHLRGTAEAFNLTNRVNYSAIVQRAYLAGTELNGVTPLVFQNAANLAAEGLNAQPFGTFTAASSGEAPERQVQLGLKLQF